MDNIFTDTTPTGVDVHEHTALIIGLTVGLFVAIVIAALLGYYCYRNHVRWRMFLRRPLTVDEVVHEETTLDTAYPITKKYYKDRYSLTVKP